jgi:hypothetical protein
MKITKLFLVMLFSIAVAACGGGGGGSSTPASTTSGTAAQYFTKKAVGNTWSMLTTETVSEIVSGKLIATGVYVSTVKTNTASTSGVITVSDKFTYPTSGFTSTDTGTAQIDATGAWVETGNTGTFGGSFLRIATVLPATFSVGTTWATPADPTMGQIAINQTVVAFNVTKTVPAGTFTDCLQINVSIPSYGGAFSASYYLSPTAGTVVDSTEYSWEYGGQNSTQYTSELQAGYVANP